MLYHILETHNTDIFTVYHILQIGTHPKASHSVVSALYDYHSSINMSLIILIIIIIIIIVVIKDRCNSKQYYSRLSLLFNIAVL
jgi:hypothetical protein